MAKAKSENVVVVNTGMSAIYIDRNRVMPDESIEIPASYLELPAFGSMFLRGSMIIKDNAEATAEIVSRVKSKVKPDPFAGKTKKELEDGGEF